MKDETHLIPSEFHSIISKINRKQNRKKQIKIEKGITKGNKMNNAIARVIKHNDSPITQTVFIQNTPEAHKVFGVRNLLEKLPALRKRKGLSKMLNKSRKVIQNLQRLQTCFSLMRK